VAEPDPHVDYQCQNRTATRKIAVRTSVRPGWRGATFGSVKAQKPHG
jgi:hypothetical protein